MDLGLDIESTTQYQARERTNHQGILSIHHIHTHWYLQLEPERNHGNKDSIMKKAEMESGKDKFYDTERRKEQSNNAQKQLRKARITLTE